MNFNEYKKVKYWLHIAIIVVLTLGTLQLLFKGDMFTLKNVLISIPLIGISDIISHKVTGLK